jgi:hypothetical protein
VVERQGVLERVLVLRGSDRERVRVRGGVEREGERISTGMPSGLPAISGQELNVSEEETAALIAAAAQAVSTAAVPPGWGPKRCQYESGRKSTLVRGRARPQSLLSVRSGMPHLDPRRPWECG